MAEEDAAGDEEVASAETPTNDHPTNDDRTNDDRTNDYRPRLSTIDQGRTTNNHMWLLQTTDRSEAGPFAFRLMPGAIKTVGRSTTADFILDVGMVSRFHCRLTASPGGQGEIADLDSTNGTFVNDKRVQKGPLQIGDRVRIGRVELVVTDGRES